MTEMLKNDCHGYVLKISEEMNTRKHLNMKIICIKMVPAVLGNEPEIGRNEINFTPQQGLSSLFEYSRDQTRDCGSVQL
jgi:hypothetical protein